MGAEDVGSGDDEECAPVYSISGSEQDVTPETPSQGQSSTSPEPTTPSTSLALRKVTQLMERLSLEERPAPRHNIFAESRRTNPAASNILPRERLTPEDFSHYSAASRRIMASMGFNTDRPHESGYGSEVPVPLQIQDEHYQLPCMTRGLGLDYEFEAVIPEDYD